MVRPLLFAAAVACGCSAPDRAPPAGVPVPPTLAPVALPGGEGGIGFDDLGWAPGLGRLIIPGGRSGAVDLLDPVTGAVTQIGGFAHDDAYAGGHGEGTTSAIEAGARLYAIDRTTKRLAVIDPASRAVVASAPLAASPDYVRWVAPTGELWVTEPDAEQIEVFAPGAAGAPDTAPRPVATIAVAGGPESLAISPRRGRAYTHRWDGATVAIDLATHAIVGTWPNGCAGSRGIALDDARGWLFVGCSEGKATVLDVDHDGRALGAITTGDGVDVIAYAPSRRRLYVPAARSATLSVLAVSDDGALTPMTTVRTARGAHCAATDDAGHVWVCDPDRGRLLRLDDE